MGFGLDELIKEFNWQGALQSPSTNVYQRQQPPFDTNPVLRGVKVPNDYGEALELDKYEVQCRLVPIEYGVDHQHAERREEAIASADQVSLKVSNEAVELRNSRTGVQARFLVLKVLYFGHNCTVLLICITQILQASCAWDRIGLYVDLK